MEQALSCKTCVKPYPKTPKSKKDQCPKCYQKEYYLTHKKEFYEYNRSWRKSNPEKKREQSRREYKKNPLKYYVKDRAKRMKDLYGLSPGQDLQMYEAQEGKCASCHIPNVLGTRWGLAVDHNHATGKVRDLICQGCNRALGNVNESITKLEDLIKYLRKHGA